MSRWQKLKWRLIEFLAQYVVPCDVVTHRLSDQHQRRLTVRERASNLCHKSICVWCRRYDHQLDIVHSAVHEIASDPARTTSTADRLSDDARERIRRALDASGDE